MERLIAELHRLFLGQTATPASLTDDAGRQLPEQGLRLAAPFPEGSRRVFCIAFPLAGDWESAALLQVGVQEDLDLPAPLLSVDGRGLRLWFPLAEAVPIEQGQALLGGLLRRYLPDLPASRVEADAAATLVLPPARLGESERWTAFIDPTMGSMFGDEAWLDMPPNPDKQADLLASCRCATIGDFKRALARLAPLSPPEAANVESSHARSERAPQPGTHADPRAFLFAVMNDPGIDMGHRIAAAQALLPYFSDALPS